VALEEIPLKRIRTPAGDVAEYSSFRDGLLTLAQAVIDIRNALIRLDRKVIDDLNTMDDEVSKMKEEVRELRDGLSGVVEELRKDLGELANKVSSSLEEKVLPVLSYLREKGLEMSEALELIKALGLRLERLEVRLSALEREVQRLALAVLGKVEGKGHVK